MTTLVRELSAVWCECKGDNEPVCDDDDGDVKREGRRAMYEPLTGVIGSSGKEGEYRCARLLGFRQWGAQSEEQNGLFLALKQGNVATFGATSRHDREDFS